MAIYSLLELIKRNNDIVEYYNNAIEIWQEIRAFKYFHGAKHLPKELTRRQPEFQQRCGGKLLGMEIMIYAGIGQYFINGCFRENMDEVMMVREALMKSFTAREFKIHVEHISDMLGLDAAYDAFINETIEFPGGADGPDTAHGHSEEEFNEADPYMDTLYEAAETLLNVRQTLMNTIFPVAITGELKEWAKTIDIGEAFYFTKDIYEACDDENIKLLLKVVGSIETTRDSLININGLE